MKTSWGNRAVTYHWEVVKTLRSHRYRVLQTNRESEKKEPLSYDMDDMAGRTSNIE